MYAHSRTLTDTFILLYLCLYYTNYVFEGVSSNTPDSIFDLTGAVKKVIVVILVMVM